MPALSSNRISRAFSVGDAATTHHARGQALEDLMIYVLRRVPGVRFVERDVRVAAGSEEIDLVFWNDRLPNGFAFLPNILVFECKNWAVPVNSAAVSFFANKVRTRHLECGFLIAANGITGDAAELTAAHQHVDLAFVRDNVRLLVFERAEMEGLSHTDQLLRLIQHKIAQIVLRAR